MNKLTLAEIGDKTSPTIKKLQSLSFEYLLAGISKEYSTINGLSSPSDFNNHNDIFFFKAAVYPFFVAMSNGHAESLFNLFGEYFTFSFGPASKSIIEVIQNQNDLPVEDRFKYFQISVDETPIKIKNANSFETFDDLKNKIKLESILYHGQPTTLGNIEIPKDDTSNPETHSPIFKAIDNSITAIITQSNSSFFRSNWDGFVFQASHFRSLREAYKENRVEMVPDYSRVVVSPEQRPFYYREPEHA